MIETLIKIPFLKRLIPSLSIKVLKLLKKNRGYFKIQNIEMFLDFLDPIDRKIILYQNFENIETNFLISQINSNKIRYFFDVGANCGYYSVFIAQKVLDINIFSFEPNKEAHFKLKKTLDKNPDLSKKIKLENFGLSDKSCELEMQSMIKHGYSQTGGSSVIVKNKYKNFDSFFANFKTGDEYINLINKIIALKIDVEGHEHNVLKGLENVLKNNKALIQIEIYDRNFKDVDFFLLSLGYKSILEIQERSNYFYSNID
tara:strand:- start:55 stop:828 length:774 start_codon:yes stop_codon:yes gene_type:complete